MFYDREEIVDLATEIDQGAEPVTVDSNMPQLSSITLTNKLYNTRMKNEPGDLR